MSTISC